jgi:hypothetical protein
LRLAQEQACDDAVFCDGVRADEYASLLCSVARSARQCAVAMAQPSTLERRVRAIVDERRNRSALGWWTAVAGVLLVVGVVACSTTAQVAKEQPKTQVLMEARIIEAPAGRFKAPPTVKELLAAKDVDVLSAPKVTTFTGQKAEISVGQEVEELKDGKRELVFVGVRLSLLPEMRGENIQVAMDLSVRNRGGKAKKLQTKVEVRPGEPTLCGGLQSDRSLCVILTASLPH